jgi:hypothetical protein
MTSKPGSNVRIDVVTHYLETDKKFESSYRYVTVEVNGKIRRVDEFSYGRGQDRADAYVDAIYEWSGWKIDLRWIDRADAKVPVKSKPKSDNPLTYTPKSRNETV